MISFANLVNNFIYFDIASLVNAFKFKNIKIFLEKDSKSNKRSYLNNSTI